MNIFSLILSITVLTSLYSKHRKGGAVVSIIEAKYF